MPEVQDEFTPRKAVKSQVKLKLGLSGPSNAGKTEGALALATAFGSVTDATRKPRILLVDSENRSASLYADRYDFDTIPLSAPYTPERYKKAMYQAIVGDYDWLIVDTISHEWEAEGGILRKKDRIDAANPNSNSFSNWNKVMPDHESFIEFIKQIPCHTICTMRSKQAYVLESNDKGKQKPRKLGMAPIQREGVDYEFSLVFDLEHPSHNATVSKNRTTLFTDGEPINLKNPVVAQEIRGWLEAGAVLTDQPEFKLVEAKPESRSQAPQQERPPARATKPRLISNHDKQLFWIAAREHNKSDEDVRIYLWDRFKIQSSQEIPAEFYEEAMKWAKTLLEERKLAEGEAEARDAARLLGVSETDLQYELSMVKGDWRAVYTVLSNRAEEEEQALAAMNKKTA
jgi:AAA domain